MGDRVGQQLGNYSLLRLVGQGSFADIYLGEHIHLHTQAAIKVLQVRLVENSVPNFLNEARTIAHLVHPYIIRVLDFGVQDTTPFLVMDYAPKGTFRQRFLQGKPLPPAPLASYMRQTAAALQYAHDRKLVHRDVKPENMLLGPNDEVLLSDFGFALASQSTTSNSLSETAGTAAYMAPEQLQGKSRPASDQYSLGIIAYEWLTGSRPFDGSFFEIASQHMLTPPTPLRERIPSIAREIETVVMTALEKDPKQRFPSVREFAVALGEACLTAQEYDFDLPSTPLPSQQLRPTTRNTEPDPALLSAFTKNTFTESSPSLNRQEPFARMSQNEQQIRPTQQTEQSNRTRTTMDKTPPNALSNSTDSSDSPFEYKQSPTQTTPTESTMVQSAELHQQFDKQSVQNPREAPLPSPTSNPSSQSKNTPSINFPSVQQYPSLSGIRPFNSTQSLADIPPLKPASGLSDVILIKPDATDTYKPAESSDTNLSPSLPNGTNISLANISIIRPDDTAPETPVLKSERPANPKSPGNFNNSLAGITIIRPDDTNPRTPTLESNVSPSNSRPPQPVTPPVDNRPPQSAIFASTGNSSGTPASIQPELRKPQTPPPGTRPFAAGVFTASGILPTAQTTQATFSEGRPFNANPSAPPIAVSGSPTVPTYSANGQGQSNSFTSTPFRDFKPTTTPTGRGKSSLSSKAILIVAALLIVIVGGSSLAYWAMTNHAQTPQSTAQPTATIHRVDVAATTTATAHQASATAAAVALNANPYAPNTGTLVLSDPLIAGEQATNWSNSTSTVTGSSCNFAPDGYHVIAPRTLTGMCLDSNANYGNFTYEVQMTFNKIGTQFSSAGLIFRDNATTNQYYRFEIYESGRYMLSLCTGNGDNCNPLAGGAGSPIITAFNANLNQTNTLAIVAKDNTFTIYVNNKPVTDPITDPNSTLATGTLGFYAHGGKDAIPNGGADVTFSKVRIWKLVA